MKRLAVVLVLASCGGSEAKRQDAAAVAVTPVTPPDAAVPKTFDQLLAGATKADGRDVDATALGASVQVYMLRHVDDVQILLTGNDRAIELSLGGAWLSMAHLRRYATAPFPPRDWDFEHDGFDGIKRFGLAKRVLVHDLARDATGKTTAYVVNVQTHDRVQVYAGDDHGWHLERMIQLAPGASVSAPFAPLPSLPVASTTTAAPKPRRVQLPATVQPTKHVEEQLTAHVEEEPEPEDEAPDVAGGDVWVTAATPPPPPPPPPPGRP